MSHTPEPWGLKHSPSKINAWPIGPGGSPLIDEVGNFRNAEDARRAVACVNALEGVPTELLEDSAPGGYLRDCIQVIGLLQIRRPDLLMAYMTELAEDRKNRGES